MQIYKYTPLLMRDTNMRKCELYLEKKSLVFTSFFLIFFCNLIPEFEMIKWMRENELLEETNLVN